MAFTDSFTTDKLWVEKYRPKTVDQLVADDNFKVQLKNYIENPNKMNHQIYIGPPGSGKTTTARILVDHIIKDKSDLIVLNGSEQKGIQIIRDIILDFVKIPPVFSPVKIVFIDEADNLTSDAWKSLRFIMENYSGNARFIMTGNKDTFPDFIKSRASVRKFSKMDKKFIYNFTRHILENEGISYDEDDLNIVINAFYPDLRRIVSVLQELSINGALDLSSLQEVLTNEEKVISMLTDLIIKLIDLNSNQYAINSLKYTLLRFVSDRYIDYHNVYKTLFEKINYTIMPIKILISKYTNRLSYVIEPTMLFFEFVDELINTINDIKTKYPIDINTIFILEDENEFSK